MLGLAGYVSVLDLVLGLVRDRVGVSFRSGLGMELGLRLGLQL